MSNIDKSVITHDIESKMIGAVCSANSSLSITIESSHNGYLLFFCTKDASFRLVTKLGTPRYFRKLDTVYAYALKLCPKHCSEITIKTGV